MPSAPCLAFLLDTPGEPGVVVTYRCARPAGHGSTEHRDDTTTTGVVLTWDATEDVTWTPFATYPVHPDRYPWNDDPEPTAAAVPPMPTTPTTTDPEPAGAPWAQLRADARAATTPPAEELS